MLYIRVEVDGIISHGVDLAADVFVADLAPAFADQVVLDGQTDVSFPEFHETTVVDGRNPGKRGFWISPRGPCARQQRAS